MGLIYIIINNIEAMIIVYNWSPITIGANGETD